MWFLVNAAAELLDGGGVTSGGWQVLGANVRLVDLSTDFCHRDVVPENELLQPERLRL